jgi:hypothetical protein
MSNQIVDGDNSNYVLYWLNQASLNRGKYTIGNTTTYNIPTFITQNNAVTQIYTIGPIPFNTSGYLTFTVNGFYANPSGQSEQSAGERTHNFINGPGSPPGLIISNRTSSTFGTSITGSDINVTVSGSNLIFTVIGGASGPTYWTGVITILYAPMAFP